MLSCWPTCTGDSSMDRSTGRKNGALKNNPSLRSLRLKAFEASNVDSGCKIEERHSACTRSSLTIRKEYPNVSTQRQFHQLTFKDRPRRNAQRRRNYGRDECGAGGHRRERRSCLRHGARARARANPRRRRGCAYGFAEKAKRTQAPYELVKMVAKIGKLPVPNFSAGGIATPADASLVMQLGAEAVFVGSGIFMKDSTSFAEPAEAEKRARAIVKAATHFNDPKVLLEVSEDLTGAMKGLAIAALDEASMLQTRGW